jgi:hypothetical protein
MERKEVVSMKLVGSLIAVFVGILLLSGCNVRDLSIDPDPTTWCFVVDRTMPEAIQEAVTQRVAEALQRRFIQMDDFVAIVTIGREGTVVWDGSARNLPEASCLFRKMASFSGEEGSNITAGLHAACVVLNEHKGPKRLIVVSDLIPDPWKRGALVVHEFADPAGFDWGAELHDPSSTTARFFGVSDNTGEHLSGMFGRLKAAEVAVFRPTHRITAEDVGCGKER